MTSALDSPRSPNIGRNAPMRADDVNDILSTSSHSIPPGARAKVSRGVHIIKNYLERSNDINTAIGCLSTLVKVGSAFGNECDLVHQRHLLQTMLVAIDVLRNHSQDVDPSLRPSFFEYLDKLHVDDSSTPDIEFAFLIKCVRSGLSFTLKETQHEETFCGLIFDVASILLSHAKYDVTECLRFLEKSRLDWYICGQVIKSVLLQHSDFSYVPANTNGTLYSVLDLRTALEKLEAICPTYENGSDATSPVDRMSKLDLLAYSALEAAQNMLGNTIRLPGKGFLKLCESIICTPSTILRFKTLDLICSLQYLVDTTLKEDTLGSIPLEKGELDSLLAVRVSTSRHLSSSGSSNGDSHTQTSLHNSVKRRFRDDTVFYQRIVPQTSYEVDTAHLAIIKLDDWATRRKMTLSQRVQEYFRNNGLSPLMCPISERPMTDAIYLRCGKTVNQAALEELIAGNIPESHCCCDEIHVDVAHKLHDCPLISDLAIHHLRRALDITDIVKYGDLPTLQYVFPEVKRDEKVKLLHLAVASKNLTITTFLLNSGVDVNSRDDGKTPLILAATAGSTELLMALLHFGARPADRDGNGVSPLTYASRNDHQAIVDILFTKTTNIALESVLSSELEIPEKDRENIATGLHDLWLGLKEGDSIDSILYLQRAMELDPENHLFAEEMQAYLDDQEILEADRMYVSLTDEAGNLYEGFTLQGVRCGAGKLTYHESNTTLESFDGEWEDNLKRNGLLTGSQYHGDVSSRDERHGQGIFYLPNGAWYEGSWIRNEMHGHGKYCFENGDLYEGSFERDTLSGRGKLLHSNGDYYDGMWKNGVKHGYGTYDLDSVGLRYEGFWMNDKKHGAGFIKYPDGSQFRGEFADDEPLTDDTSPDFAIRQTSAETRTTTDGESIDSFKSDQSGKSAASRLENAERKLKHQRSRSFADTVGRKIR